VDDTASGGAAARILSAAEELFAARGFAGVSARDIAERAGEKKASVFYHFGSKPELFQRVLERYYAAHAEALGSASAGPGDARERLHRLIDAYLDFAEDHEAYMRLVQHEIAAGSEFLPEVQRGLALLLDRVQAILADLVPATGPLSARQFFLTFSGIVNAYQVFAPALGPLWGEDPRKTGARRERRAHVHWVADALLAGLEGERRRA